MKNFRSANLILTDPETKREWNYALAAILLFGKKTTDCVRSSTTQIDGNIQS